MSFSVLYVCTGNVCRSPVAELIMRAWAAPRSGLSVSSAGIQALVGHPIDHGSAKALRQLGIDPSTHRARQLEPGMVSDADLVLTAETTHRDRVMTAVPRAFRRTFTLKEFAQLVAQDGSSGSPSAVVAAAAANRSGRGELPWDADNIADPYRRGTDLARSTTAEIADAVRTTLRALGFGSRLQIG
jgi:protein-tyrosine-phosphatase